MPSFFYPPANMIYLLLVPFLIWFFIALFQYPWNCTIPGIFKIREISFWEAFRLLLISGFLFGGSFLRFRAGG